MPEKPLRAPCLVLLLLAPVGCSGGDDGDGGLVIDWGAGGPLAIQASYEVCAGARGSCSSDGCCASRFPRVISTDEAVASCEVVGAGGGGDTYALSFSAASTLESQPALSGQGITFQAGPLEPAPVAGCTQLAITDASVTHVTARCDTLDVRPEPPGGGGCVVEAAVNAQAVISLRFTCEEIQAQGQDLYLSTLYGSEVGPGEIRLEGCQYRPQ